jgi:pSer/pThr/pTyr-binding forkhead associated (FHA) protein
VAPPTPLPGRPAPRTARPGGTARLTTIRADGLPGTVHALEEPEAVFGRTEGSIRVADDPGVSPRHARFTLRDGVLAVEDLGSLNGTFLRIRAPSRLGVGAELRVGRQLLRLEPRAPAPPATPGARAFGASDPGGRFRLSQLLEGGGLGEIFPLVDGENAVGREAGRVTFPADRYVSARHARLEVKGEVVTVEDLASSNGTFVRLSGRAQLAPGDQLLLGAQLLRVDV